MTNNVLKIDAYSDLRRPRPTRETEATVIKLNADYHRFVQDYAEAKASSLEQRCQEVRSAIGRIKALHYEEQQANRQRAKDAYNAEASPVSYERPKRKPRREKTWDEIKAEQEKQRQITEAILIKHGIKKVGKK